MSLDDEDFGDEAGRLIEPGADDDAIDLRDEEPEAVASAVPGDDLSAEEAAVHLTEPPPMGDADDGYVR